MEGLDKAIPKFKGYDFPVWKAQIEAFLMAKGMAVALYKIATDYKEDENVQANFQKVDTQARSILLLALDTKYVRVVLKCRTAKDVWDRLNAIHEQKSDACRLVKQREFYELRMKPNETAEQFVTRAEYLAGQLEDLGVGVNASVVVSKIVTGLREEYQSFMSLWATTDKKNHTVDKLLGMLMAEDAMKKQFKKDESSALVSNYQKRFEKKEPRINKQKPKEKVKERNKTKLSLDQVLELKRKTQCFICKEKGHWKTECPRYKGGPSSSQMAVKQVRGEEQEEMEAIITECNNMYSMTEWILDSGATQHMTNDILSYASYQKLSIPKKVRFGNNQFGEGVGIGTIAIKSKVNNTVRPLILRDVLHVPGLSRKLISVSAATKNGQVGEILNDRIILRGPSGHVNLIAFKRGNLYVLDIEEAIEAANSNTSTKEITNVQLWHERFGHLNQATLLQMSKTDAVIGLDKLKKENKDDNDLAIIPCQSCALGKQVHVSFPSSKNVRASKVGQTVHIDICGPIATPTIGGAQYFVLAKDEYSNYRFVIFIKTKDQAFEALQKIVMQFKSDTGLRINKLKSDCGSEFCSKKAEEYLLQQEIVHEKSPPFCPQMNGFIERDNRTIMESARTMLFHRNVPAKLWGEAVNTAVYVMNRSCNKNTINETPHKLYHGDKPNVSHLRIFGSMALMKEQEKKRSGYQKKLDPRSRRTIVVGYEKDFAYRLFDLSNNKLIITKDVLIDERYFSNENRDEAAQQDLLEISDEHNNNSDVMHALTTFEDEPQSYSEALNRPDSYKWKEAMKNEYDSLLKNDTWNLCPLPEGRKAISSKWVFKLKRLSNGEIDRYKARLVARGFSQKEGIDYSETYSPVVRMDSVRILLMLAAQFELDITHIDVKTAFLYGTLNEDIYLSQPIGFEQQKGVVCKLNKSLYGLKQASKQWNSCFTEFLTKFGLKALLSDNCIFLKRNKDTILIIAIYVDDGLVMSNNKEELSKVIAYLKSKFEITTMNASCFVGIQITRNEETKAIYLSQEGYINRIVSRFNLKTAKFVSTPFDSNQKLCKEGATDNKEHETVQVPYRQAIGSLMYAMIGSRPDIAYAVGILSRYSDKPRLVHWNAVKRVLKYLSSTATLNIKFEAYKELKLTCYVDADFAADIDSRKSITGFVLLLNDTPVCWKSTKQATVALSTTEAEFVAASIAIRETIWIRTLLKELGHHITEPTKVFIDNQGAITLMKNRQIHSKTKHIDIKLMFSKEKVESKEIVPVYVPSKEQIADIMTKPLPRDGFTKARESLKLTKKPTSNSTSLVSVGAIALVLIALAVEVELTSSRNYRLILDFENPCSMLADSRDFAPHKFESYVENRQTTGLLRKLCHQHYSERITEALKGLNACLARRLKRNIISTVVDFFGAGISNLVSTKFQSTNIENFEAVHKELIQEVNKAGQDILSTQEGMKEEVIKEIQFVSNSSLKHIVALEDSLRDIPLILFGMHLIEKKSLATLADIKAIRMHCRKGQVATNELGELLGFSDLQTIDPINTEMTAIHVDMDTEKVHFDFKVNESSKESISTTGSGLSVQWIIIISISSTLTISVCAISVIVKCTILKKRTNIANDESKEREKSESPREVSRFNFEIAS